MCPPRGFGLGAQLIADQPVDGTVAQVHLVLLGQIALNLTIAGKALWLREPLLEGGQDRRGEGTPFSGRGLDGQQPGEAARFILPQSRPNGMAMDGEQGGQRDARRGLATGQKV